MPKASITRRLVRNSRIPNLGHASELATMFPQLYLNIFFALQKTYHKLS